MRISLSGLLGNLRCSIASGEHPGGELYMLDELARHLALLRDEPTRIGEFFALYVDVEPIGEDFPMTALSGLFSGDGAYQMVRRMPLNVRAEMMDALREVGDDTADLPQ